MSSFFNDWAREARIKKSLTFIVDDYSTAVLWKERQ